MSRLQSIVRWSSVGEQEVWEPTTLDRLNKDEEFFESVLARTPDLLGLQSRRTGVSGPFYIARQLPLCTPAGREIYPDLVLLSASGHVVLVEIKRGSNPELAKRDVIAQLVEYASSLSALSEQDLLKLLRGKRVEPEHWADLVKEFFPLDPDPEDLAAVILSRINRGELHLVIACDRVPPGLPAIIEGVTTQKALAFELDLVEVVPFVRTQGDSGDILFVPTTRLATQIVARTAVTVRFLDFPDGGQQPSVSVETTTLEEIEQHSEAARKTGNPLSRSWTPEEVEAEFRRVGNPADMALLDFAIKHGADGQFVSPGEKRVAGFGLYIKGRGVGGKPASRMVFLCSRQWETSVSIFLNAVDDITSEEVSREFRRRLKETFGESIDVTMKQPNVRRSVIAEKIEAFCEHLLWLKDAANRR